MTESNLPEATSRRGNPLPEKRKRPGKKRRERFSSLQALGLGLVADVGGSILVTRLFAFTFGLLALGLGFYSSTLFMAWTMIIGLAGVFSGAFLAAHFAPSRPLLHAAVIGMLDLAVSAMMVSPVYWTSFLLVYALLAAPAVLTAGTAAAWIDDAETKKLPGGDGPKLLT